MEPSDEKRASVLRFLLDSKKIDPYAINNDDKTAFKMALENGFTICAELLLLAHKVEDRVDLNRYYIITKLLDNRFNNIELIFFLNSYLDLTLFKYNISDHISMLSINFMSWKISATATDAENLKTGDLKSFLSRHKDKKKPNQSNQDYR